MAGDLLGGLTAAVVALPISLAFGVASGLGAQAGIYGAIACGIFAALFGGTPGQISGPTGPMTVVVAGMAAAAPGRPDLVFAAVFAGGIFQIMLGRMRSGGLIQYVPYPVISGFMTGIGAIIIALQVRPLIGLPATGNVLEAVQSYPAAISQLNGDALMLGALTLALTYTLPVLHARIPASLCALIAATLLASTAGMDVPTIGAIPSGLPLPRLPSIAFTDLHVVLMNGVSLAVLGALDSLLTSVVLDKITHRRHDSDRELIGQGAGNMVSALIGGLPGAGATMRSVVNVRSGGTSSLSGVVHGVVLLSVLICFGQIAARIPLASLAGILIAVGISILDYRLLARLRKAPRSDVAVMLVVLFLTIFVDLIVAVLVGVCLACTLFAKNLSDARLSEVGRLDTLEHIRQMAEHLPEAVRKSIYTYTFNGPLFFGEVKNFTEAMDALAGARYIILKFYNVPMVDLSGAYALEDAEKRWESHGTKVLFVGIRPHVRQTLETVGVIHQIGMDNVFEDLHSAIAAIDEYESERAGQ